MRPIASNSSNSPTNSSKKFAGGFGRADSVFTQSHVNNARKLSHYRLTQDRFSNAGNPSSGKSTQKLNYKRMSFQEAQANMAHFLSKDYGSSENSVEF